MDTFSDVKNAPGYDSEYLSVAQETSWKFGQAVGLPNNSGTPTGPNVDLKLPLRQLISLPPVRINGGHPGCARLLRRYVEFAP